MNSLFLKARSLHSLKLEKERTLKAGDSIYFMGICGTAMASLAVYLKKQGFEVSGSDQDIYPPMSLVLKKEGLPVFEYSAGNIKDSFSLIVVGNVISSSHIEIQKAKDLDIPVLSLPEFLQQSLLSHTKNIVIVGTHGKSTSTALMAHTAESSGKKPGFFIGGFPYDFNSSFRASGPQSDSMKVDSSLSCMSQADSSQFGLSQADSFQADKLQESSGFCQTNFLQGDSTQSVISQIDSPQANSQPADSYQRNRNSLQPSLLKVDSFQTDLSQTDSSSNHLLQDKSSGYFVIEGDEYDTSFFAKRAKFFYYNPHYVILTGIEFDHADIYKNLEEIERSFSKFLAEIPTQGALVACIENQTVKNLLSLCKASVLTYGLGKGDYQIKRRKIITLSKPSDFKKNDLQDRQVNPSGNRELGVNNSEDGELGSSKLGANNLDDSKLGVNNSEDNKLQGDIQSEIQKDNSQSKTTLKRMQEIEVLGSDKKTYQLLIPLLGLHNALNALGVFVLAKHLQWKEGDILKALKNFKGLKRRLEFRFEYRGVLIFEDFAHHPTAIEAGLSALKESYPQKRLMALFEPRSFTARSDLFQKEYVSSFKLADLIFIAQPYQSYKKENQLSVKTLIDDLKKEGKKAFACQSFEELEQEFKRQIQKEDLAVFMSSGAFGSILENLN